MSRRTRGGIALAVAAVSVAVASAGTLPETFTATATVTKGATRGSTAVTITVTRYATDSERAAVMEAVREGGAAARKALSALRDAGFVQLGERRTPIKFAAERQTSSGRLVTVVTSDPILFLGAGIPAAKPASGHEVAIAMLVLTGDGGEGELAPAADLSVDDEGGIVIEDYGATVVWLTGIARSR